MDDEEVTMEGSNRHRVIRNVLCMIGTTIVIVVVILLATRNRNNNNTKQPLPEDNIPPVVVVPPTMAPSTPGPEREPRSPRFVHLFVALRPFLLPNVTLTAEDTTNPLLGLDDLTNDQYRTLEWLATVDDARVVIENADDPGIGEPERGDTILPLEWVIERYVLAHLYLVTEGDQWKERHQENGSMNNTHP